MTDRTPKLLVDALGAIESAQEFVAGSSLVATPQTKCAAPQWSVNLKFSEKRARGWPGWSPR